MIKHFKSLITLSLTLVLTNSLHADESSLTESTVATTPIQIEKGNDIFEDDALIAGYTKRYEDLSLDIILEMIKDETLSPYQTSAAIRVLNKKFIADIVSREKINVEKILIRRLNRTDSPYVQVEAMSALCLIDRYRYFQAMVPALIQKLNHYNKTVRETAFTNINDIIHKGNIRPREARTVFNTLRKILFLERRRLATIKNPDHKLEQKLKLVRWCVKVLGSQELQKLPKEVISLL